MNLIKGEEKMFAGWSVLKDLKNSMAEKVAEKLVKDTINKLESASPEDLIKMRDKAVEYLKENEDKIVEKLTETLKSMLEE